MSDKQKNSGSRRIIQILIFAVCFIALIISFSTLVKYFYDDYRSEQINSQIASAVNSAAESQPVTSESTILPKFESLLQENRYLVGWIQIEDTPVNYPVVQAEDNDLFLRRDFYGKGDNNGTIFVDYRSQVEPQGKNLLIYGHNMKSTKMFSTLPKYEKLSYYREHPLIRFDRLTEEAAYKIFAVVLTDLSENRGEDDLQLYFDFVSDEQFLGYIDDARAHSFLNIPVDVRPDDQIITLITCAYDFDDARLLVLARKLREGESTDVDVSAASVNKDVLMPARYED